MKSDSQNSRLSSYAHHKLHHEWEMLFGGFAVLSWFIMTLGTLFAVILSSGLPGWFAAIPVPITLLLGGLIWLIPRHLIYGRKWTNFKRQVFQEDQIDYERSLSLQYSLVQFLHTPVSNFQTRQSPVSGSWFPFRVEHFPSASLRSSITGRVNLRSLFQGRDIRGLVTPNLLDTSTIIWLKNRDNSATLRVILPSIDAIAQLFSTMKSSWFTGHSGYNRTHCDVVIDNFVLSDEHFYHLLDHAQTIDILDASCQQPPDARPVVEVYGQVIQPGVIIGTALRVCDHPSSDVQIFLPDGFFTKFTHTVDGIMRRETPAPQPSDSIAV